MSCQVVDHLAGLYTVEQLLGLAAEPAYRPVVAQLHAAVCEHLIVREEGSGGEDQEHKT